MKEFKILGDVDACRFDNPETKRVVRQAVATLIEVTTSDGSAYNPDAEGWVVLLGSRHLALPR